MILKMYIDICNKQTAVVNLSCCDGIASLISSGGLFLLFGGNFVNIDISFDVLMDEIAWDAG